jgi:iron(II)-dependent oxidoreductase
MTVDGMQFCYVPPGPFEMGSGDEDDLADDDEKPAHTFNIEYGYWLGRYPVTVAQWQEFVTDSGHQPKSENSLRDPANRPVRDVTWYEAVKFCGWLTKRWRETGYLPEGWQVRLPSEAEWEKAARGGLEIPLAPEMGTLREIEMSGSGPPLKMGANPLAQRRYPWGNEPEPNRANYDATGIGIPSAAGCFPGGATVYGCEEMSGNVWEWCATKWQNNYEDYQNDNTTDRTGVPRVLRGGAFYYVQQNVRCAVRFDFNPFDRNWDYGFRLVCVAPIDL